MTINNNANLRDSFSLGAEAYRQGSETLSRSSQELADSARQGNGQLNSINKAAVNMVSGELQAQAGAKVMSRANDMIGSIIDTFA
jgi:hypothetical protein